MKRDLLPEWDGGLCKVNLFLLGFSFTQCLVHWQDAGSSLEVEILRCGRKALESAGRKVQATGSTRAGRWRQKKVPVKISVWVAEGICPYQLPFSWWGKRSYPWERVGDGWVVLDLRRMKHRKATRGKRRSEGGQICLALSWGPMGNQG